MPVRMSHGQVSLKHVNVVERSCITIDTPYTAFLYLMNIQEVNRPAERVKESDKDPLFFNPIFLVSLGQLSYC